MVLKFLKGLFTSKEYPEFNEKQHKICDECGGSGLDFIAGSCFVCEGNGFIDKTRYEVWKESI